MNYNCARPPKQRAFDTSLLMWRRRLLGGAAPDAYAVGGFEPAFVADFAGTLNSGTEYYRSGGNDTTFSSVFTHTKGDDKPFTMTDSDGVLKWGAHNFKLYSSDFSNAAWVKSQCSFSTGTLTASAVTGDPYIYQALSPAAIPANTACMVHVRVQAGTHSLVCLTFYDTTAGQNHFARVFDLSDGTEGQSNAGAGCAVISSSITAVGDGSYDIKLVGTCDSSSNNQGLVLSFAPAKTGNTFTAIGTIDGTWSGTETILLYRASINRADLGGMVNNPDTGDSYVPTTTAARFLPRRNHYLYNGSTYDNSGILIEPAAATNLATYSNTFTNAAWSTNAANETLTAAASTGPDGATSMTRLNDDSGTGTGEVYVDQAVTVATSTAYTFSVYAKADQLSWIALGAENFTTPANGESFFNLSAGTVGTAATGHTARIENVAGGIYRCSITFTTDASDTSGNIRIYVADADTDITVDRDGTSSVYIYGAQFEAGSVPTSYIPVVAGSTFTRAAETLTVAGSNLPANTTAMSFNMSGKMTYSDTSSALQAEFYQWRVNDSNQIFARLDTTGANTGSLNVFQYASGVADVVLGTINAFSPGNNVTFNIAQRSTSSAINGAVAGTSYTENSTPTALADLSSAAFELNCGPPATGNAMSIGLLRIWGTDIGDSGIETAST